MQLFGSSHISLGFVFLNIFGRSECNEANQFSPNYTNFSSLQFFTRLKNEKHKSSFLLIYCRPLFSSVSNIFLKKHFGFVYIASIWKKKVSLTPPHSGSAIEKFHDKNVKRSMVIATTNDCQCLEDWKMERNVVQPKICDQSVQKLSNADRLRCTVVTKIHVPNATRQLQSAKT